MADYCVNEDAVGAFRDLADKAEEAVEEVINASDNAMQCAQNNTDVLGPHVNSLEEALTNIKNSIISVTESVEIVAETLRDVADGYEEVIASSPTFGGSGGGSARSGIGGGSGSSGSSGSGAGGGSGAASGGSTNGSAGAGSNSIESIKSWLPEVNPLYNNPFFRDAKRNCGSCSYAVYKRLNGNTNAIASLSNIGTDEGMERALGKKCVYTSPQNIESYMKSQGAGAHTVCGINRTLPDGSRIAGHWFNVYYDGNKLYTIDGQSGQVYDWPHDYGYISEWCIMV